MPLAGVREPARHRLIVQHHRHALEALDQRGEPLGLGVAQHVVAEQDVVGGARVRHHLDLAELLAGDADRTGLHLHFGERRDLVGLDVRPVGEPVTGEKVLRATDVRLDDIEIDHNRGCVEVGDQSRHEFLVSRKMRRDPALCFHVVPLRKHVSLGDNPPQLKRTEYQGGTE